MSSGDRGGVAELIRLIAKSRTPIICICNDREKQSIRSLANHCLDLKMARPSVPEIGRRMYQVCGVMLCVCARVRVCMCAPSLPELVVATRSSTHARPNGRVHTPIPTLTHPDRACGGVENRHQRHQRPDSIQRRRRETGVQRPADVEGGRFVCP